MPEYLLLAPPPEILEKTNSSGFQTSQTQGHYNKKKIKLIFQVVIVVCSLSDGQLQVIYKQSNNSMDVSISQQLSICKALSQLLKPVETKNKQFNWLHKNVLTIYRNPSECTCQFLYKLQKPTLPMMLASFSFIVNLMQI